MIGLVRTRQHQRNITREEVGGYCVLIFAKRRVDGSTSSKAAQVGLTTTLIINFLTYRHIFFVKDLHTAVQIQFRKRMPQHEYYTGATRPRQLDHYRWRIYLHCTIYITMLQSIICPL